MDYTSIVFAETKGKAKAVALKTDAWCESQFIYLQVKRCPQADSRYSGQKELDWENPDERVFMVKELGFSCLEYIEAECENCAARKYCEHFQTHGGAE